MKSNEVKTNSTREGKQGTDFDRAHPHRGGRRHTETYICSESSRVSFHPRTPIFGCRCPCPSVRIGCCIAHRHWKVTAATLITHHQEAGQPRMGKDKQASAPNTTATAERTDKFSRALHFVSLKPLSLPFLNSIAVTPKRLKQTTIALCMVVAAETPTRYLLRPRTPKRRAYLIPKTQ